MRKNNYHYYSVTNGDETYWHVAEVATETVIDFFLYKEDAFEYMKFLENGGGFDGFTPTFMLNRVKLPVSIDEAFSMEFVDA